MSPSLKPGCGRRGYLEQSARGACRFVHVSVVAGHHAKLPGLVQVEAKVFRHLGLGRNVVKCHRAKVRLDVVVARAHEEAEALHQEPARPGHWPEE